MEDEANPLRLQLLLGLLGFIEFRFEFSWNTWITEKLRKIFKKSRCLKQLTVILNNMWNQAILVCMGTHQVF